jgi:hypothetical protein
MGSVFSQFVFSKIVEDIARFARDPGKEIYENIRRKCAKTATVQFTEAWPSLRTCLADFPVKASLRNSQGIKVTLQACYQTNTCYRQSRGYFSRTAEFLSLAGRIAAGRPSCLL